MPLIRSKSKRALKKNIATEIRAGKPPKQAAAIAYSIQRKSGTRIKAAKKTKRKLSPAQLAALAKGRVAMAAKRKGRKKPVKKGKKHSWSRKTRTRRSSLTPRVKRDTVVYMARKRHRRSHSKAIVSGHRGRARHVGRAIAHTASQEKYRTGALMVAAGLGFAKKQGYEIPHVSTVGEAGTIALAAWGAKKFGGIRSPWLDHLITGAGVIAIYEAVSSGNIPLLSSSEGGGGGKKKKTEGDFDDVDGAYEVR